MTIYQTTPPNEIPAISKPQQVAKGLASQPSAVTQLQQALGINSPGGAGKSTIKNIPTTPEQIDQSLSVTENTPEAQMLDGQIWKVAVTITNHSPPVKPVLVPGNYIHELVVEHSIIDPCFWKGSMIIRSNRFGILEGENPDDNISLEMLFRGDGKDEILIELSPLFADVELPAETWTVKSEFIVYDTEEIPWNQGAGMAKKIYFWHKAYNLMLEKGSSFSTARYSNIANISQASNEQRKIPVGLAIKKVLEHGGLTEYIDHTEWDDGYIDSKIFYTSSAGQSLLSTLNDILPYFVSSDQTPGILYFHRGKNKFQLISLKKFFDNAGIYEPGSLYYETFAVGTGDAGEQDGPVSPNKTPKINNSKFDYAIYIKKYSTIKDNSYIVTDPAGSDSMETFITTPYHTYDHKNKTFHVFYKDSEIKQFKTFFKRTYSDKLLPGIKGAPLIVLNSSKKAQKRVNPKYTSLANKTREIASRLGQNFLTLSTLFLNLGITFTVQGSTHRHAGRFVGLEKNKNSDNKYDFRLLGQWFVTSVTTRWQEDQLYNEITANKVSSFQDLKFNEDA